jgi:hypothetical protein
MQSSGSQSLLANGGAYLSFCQLKSYPPQEQISFIKCGQSKGSTSEAKVFIRVVKGQVDFASVEPREGTYSESSSSPSFPSKSSARRDEHQYS